MSVRFASRTAEAVAQVLVRLLPRGAALHEPELGEADVERVVRCLRSGWVSSAGAEVGEFEAGLRRFTGAGHAVAVVNGTAALHAALMVAGVGPGDEVIVPALTFVATANAVAHAGATPHFADASRETLGLDPHALRAHLSRIARVRDGVCHNRLSGRPLRAAVAMHAFGHPVDVDPLAEVCREFGLILVEDAAESLGSTYKGRHAGTLGHVAALSFNGNKIVTTGGGGAVLTADASLAQAVRHLTTTAKRPHPWAFVHDRVGYNYRLPSLNAALGLAQLERLPALVQAKRRLAQIYGRAFDGTAGLTVFTEAPYARSNYWLNALILDRADDLEPVLELTNDRGIATRPAWTPMHRLAMYADCPRMDMAVTEDLAARIVNLPSSPKLADEVAARA